MTSPGTLDINIQFGFYRVQLSQWCDYLRLEPPLLPLALIAGREDISLFSLTAQIRVGCSKQEQ